MDWNLRAPEVARELETASAQDILRWAADSFGGQFVLSSSMGDGVMPSLAASVIPGIDVLFLDTGYHFPETIGTRDAVDFVYDVTVRTVLPLMTVAEQDAAEGPELWRTNPDRCCALRKVEPLHRALEGYQAYAFGVRRDESPARANTPVVQWDAKRQMVKVNPIARWTQADVDAYIEAHDILVNPLAEDGYPSIGCRPCTHRVAPGEDPRSGRWRGSQKSECGLHV